MNKIMSVKFDIHGEDGNKGTISISLTKSALTAVNLVEPLDVKQVDVYGHSIHVMYHVKDKTIDHYLFFDSKENWSWQEWGKRIIEALDTLYAKLQRRTKYRSGLDPLPVWKERFSGFPMPEELSDLVSFQPF